MSYKIRTIKTASGNIAVQVFRFKNNGREILKHVGSARDPQALDDLKKQAEHWIKENTADRPLFELSESVDPFFNMYQTLGVSYQYAYDYLCKAIEVCRFDRELSPLMRDIVVTQILDPSSKRQNIENLKQHFQIEYDLTKLYRLLSMYDDNFKQRLCAASVGVAKREFQFDFEFVLYDVTTLYFESFKNDEFKKPGFSKDHKHNQPQVVLGLITTKEGFPVHYEVFEGNTFEGNTFLPIVLSFKQQYAVKSLSVVADAAMMSKLNLATLSEYGINYVIGARLANQTEAVLTQVQEKMIRKDGYTTRIGNLLVEYRDDRYRKDKHELEKQIERAKRNLGSTTKIGNIKFVKNPKANRELDEALIEKQRRLLGMKGYVTNLNLPHSEVIGYYHKLFRVEHAFRIAKSDLEIRPIYHYKKATIQNHILLNFVCLAVSTYLEIQERKSIRQIGKELKRVVDVRILNKTTGQVFVSRTNSDKPPPALPGQLRN